MFNFFRKKIDTINIRNFQDVVKVTHFYISEKKWEEAHKLLRDAVITEKRNAQIEIDKLDKKDIKSFEAKKTKILKNLNHNIEEIKNLEVELSQNESKFRFVPESIKRYEDAVKSIKTLIALKEFDKAKEVIKEIKKAEKRGLDKLLATLEKGGDELATESEKRKQLKIFTKKEEQLEKLLYKIKNNESKHNEKIEKEKFKIRFKKIKSEIELLSKTGKNTQALNILKHFLEEYSSNYIVIKFYNKERAKILKNIEIQKKKEEERIKQNTRLEAQKLAGQTIKIEENEEKQKDLNFFQKIKNSINIYAQIKEKIRKKKLIDEITLLIEENENVNHELATKKLENIHKGLTKELKTNSMLGYDIYGKILGVGKISGDTFGLEDSKDKYNLYIGDATGHGIKSGLIITLLTRLFNKHVKKKKLDELALEINNGLKQDLQSRNFITAVFFEILKKEINKVNYVGMGHEPMLVYRKKTDKVEKILPGGLAAGIRMIKDKKQVKVKNIILEDGDIILVFSDGTIEFKNIDGESYGINRLIDNFKQACITKERSYDIYNAIIENIFAFRGGSSFEDDNTMMLLRRDKNSDLQKEDSVFLKTISQKEKITKKDQKRLIGKNRTQIQEEIEKIKKERELKLIIANLKRLYQVGEFIKLKQESIRHIKDGRIHKDINFYLKKAIENETKYKVELKNKKIENRYNVLYQLYKKGDYNTVIKELEEIIAKDGEI